MRQEARRVYAPPMRSAVPMIAMLLVVAGCTPAPHAPEASVENALVTLPAVQGRPGAAYFTVRSNHEGTRLTGISSPRVGRIELHETVSEGGASRMRPLAEAVVSPESPLVFEPGGRHAMLFDMAPDLRVGDRLSLTFAFDPAPPVTVDVEVRGPGQVHSGH